jgi:glycosyltransferase involved in cell wall biosynthesis
MNVVVPQVVISNGYSQFHMAQLAADLHASGLLTSLITGAYPRNGASGHKLWSRYGTYRRYDARRVPVPAGMVWPIWSGEVLCQVSHLLWRLGVPDPWQSAVARASLVRYQNVATALLRTRMRGNVFHYRSGFGGPSAHTARDLGMKVVCDHSIVHPALLEHLLGNGGRLPAGPGPQTMNSFWRTVEADLALADVVVVNSDFVQETFVRAGIPRDRTRVIYLGPDRTFLDALGNLPDHRSATSPQGPLRLLAAGTMEERKGSHVLAMALCNVPSSGLEVHVVGDWHRRLPEHRRRLESLPNVRLSPRLDRRRLALEMARADAFVLPTLAEGSARVIFEAMAVGCYVITTPNAGSIVRDSVHGRLVQPGSVAQLSHAIEEARADVGRVREIGRSNALAVRKEYEPGSYGERVAELYRSLLADA